MKSLIELERECFLEQIEHLKAANRDEREKVDALVKALEVVARSEHAGVISAFAQGALDAINEKVVDP